jgi:hypothetical protein
MSAIDSDSSQDNPDADIDYVVPSTIEPYYNELSSVFKSLNLTENRKMSTDQTISADALKINELVQEIAGLKNRLNAIPLYDDNDSLKSCEISSNSFSDIGKIPDIVKEIPHFDGNQAKLVQWISDVDSVIEIFSQFKGTHHYPLILRSIRRRITGEADEILISNSVPLSWRLIKEALQLHYGDKRDLMTLNSQLNAMAKKNDTIETFFAKIQSMHTQIANTVRLDSTYKGGEKFIIDLYKNICLDTFIRGIGSPLSQFLRNFKPQTLAQAYQYALEFQNVEYRNKYSINIPSTIPSSRPQPAPRRLDQFQQQSKIIQPQKHSQFGYQGNKITQNSNNNVNQAYRNSFQNYQPVFKKSPEFQPEPMDIDESLKVKKWTPQSNQRDFNKVSPTIPKQNIRPLPDTPSWRSQIPPPKRTAHLVQTIDNNDLINHDNYVSEEEDVAAYLNIANIQSCNDDSENIEIPNGNFPLDQEQQTAP